MADQISTILVAETDWTAKPSLNLGSFSVRDRSSIIGGSKDSQLLVC